MTGDSERDKTARAGRRRSAVKPVTLDLKATEVEDAASGAKAGRTETSGSRTSGSRTAKAEGSKKKAGAPASSGRSGASERKERKAGTEQARTGPAPHSGNASSPPLEPGFFAILIAAIIGAGLALVFNFALQTSGLLPFGPARQIDEMRTALTNAERRIATLERGRRQENAAATQRLDSLATRLATLEAGEKARSEALGPPGLVGRLSALETAIGGIRGDVEKLRRELTGTARISDALDATAKRIAALETTLDRLKRAGITARERAAIQEMISPLRAEIEKLTTRSARMEDLAKTGRANGRKIAALADDIGRMKASLASGAAGSQVAIATLKDQLATITTKLAAAEATARTATARAVDAINAAEAIAARPVADTQLRASFERFARESRATLARLEKSSERIDEVKVPAIEKRLSAIERSVQEFTTRLAESRTRIGDLAAGMEKIGKLPQDMKTRLEKLNEAIAGTGADLSRRLDHLAASTDAKLAGAETTIATLTDRIAAAEARLGRESLWLHAAARITIAALKDAARDNAPFADQLAAVVEVGGASPASEALRPLAEKGVPTAADLAARFRRLDDALQRQLATPKTDDMVSRLLRRGREIVRVSRRGPITGSDPQAVMSRIRDALERADLATALGEWRKLPEPARAISSDWSKSVEARIRTDRLVAETVANVLSSLETAAR